ncbi:serine-arginine protein 55-like [Chironomus tepperi]|uniref:serine-arginine protein 55-like n=1 Tax=Chironomus tepperi TaxID=113505 RepID=UPI00391F248A
MVGSRVYVGGLPSGTRERDLEKFFKSYGKTQDIFIKNGYAFVELEDKRDADDAVYELNGKKLLGERVVVEAAKGTPRGGRYDGGSRDRYNDRNGRRGRNDRYNNSSKGNSRYGPPSRTEYRLTVENLSSRVSWQDLKDYMRQAGEVTYADAHKQNRNEGVVEFATLKDMKKAIEKLDDTELNGRRIRLVENTRRSGRRSRSRSSSTSRSRSRSRHRSRSHSKGSSRRSRESRSKSRDSRSKSPAEKKSRSRSRYSEKSRSRSRDAARSVSKDSNRDRKSRSHSRYSGKSAARSVSKESNQSNRNRSRSGSNNSEKRKSRSRDRSRSEDKKDRSRSGSAKSHSRDGNESSDD